MKKIFIILILMLSIFSITNAHPFKNEKELQDFYAKIDKEVEKELKKDYVKLFEQRKANLKEKASDDITEKNLEDDEYLFVLKNGKLEMVFKKEILNGKFRTLSRLYENGKKSRIVCLSAGNPAYYGTVKYFRENGTPLYSGQFYDGKMEGMYKEYYESGKLLMESHFSNDKENGTEKIYYENGKISSIKNYKNGVVDGEYIEYYTNGKLKLKGTYKNGLREGEFKTYLMNSKSAGSMFYKNGKEIHYTITEEVVASYRSEISGDTASGFVLKNLYDPSQPPAPKQKILPRTGTTVMGALIVVGVVVLNGGIYLAKRKNK